MVTPHAVLQDYILKGRMMSIGTFMKAQYELVGFEVNFINRTVSNLSVIEKGGLVLCKDKLIEDFLIGTNLILKCLLNLVVNVRKESTCAVVSSQEIVAHFFGDIANKVVKQLKMGVSFI